MKTIIRSLLLLLSAVASLNAAILTVDNNPGAVAMYDNFEDAYEAAMIRGIRSCWRDRKATTAPTISTSV